MYYTYVNICNLQVLLGKEIHNGPIIAVNDALDFVLNTDHADLTIAPLINPYENQK